MEEEVFGEVGPHLRGNIGKENPFSSNRILYLFQKAFQSRGVAMALEQDQNIDPKHHYLYYEHLLDSHLDLGLCSNYMFKMPSGTYRKKFT